MDSIARRHWKSRRHLPHWDLEECPVTLNYRLEGSIPAEVQERWRHELTSLSEDKRDVELRKRMEEYLDAGHGPTWLRIPEIGDLVEGGFLHFDEARYQLHAWVVMPNHVHVLLTPLAGYALKNIVHSWKRHTAFAANRRLDRSGTFWQKDYFDRTIRDERHFAAAVAYIENNPVKAGLCSRPEAWRFSSARWREEQEPNGNHGPRRK